MEYQLCPFKKNTFASLAYYLLSPSCSLLHNQPKIGKGPAVEILDGYNHGNCNPQKLGYGPL